ncbi:hypothetical protein FHR70_001013 [Microvirga lupini]|uniref:Uncharacterized protein n=1 Tax=Microvirga lupini TaxID=420324 RepID=A0A7W4VIR9_9HYPH|nr:hypothetical protein [Microvirga lupini]
MRLFRGRFHQSNHQPLTGQNWTSVIKE